MAEPPTDTVSESTFVRAWRDTTSAWTGWRFWAAQAVLLPAVSVLAVSFYPNNASSLQQAVIQGAFLLGGEVAFALAVFLGLFVAMTPRAQRDEVRAAYDSLVSHAATRGKLLDLRRSIGALLGEYGDLLTRDRGDGWLDLASDLNGEVFDLCRSENPVLDESHVGRFYAAFTKADDEASKLALSDVDHQIFIMKAEMAFLDSCIVEVNDYLRLLH